jgi:hypothetical protein
MKRKKHILHVLFSSFGKLGNVLVEKEKPSFFGAKKRDFSVSIPQSIFSWDFLRIVSYSTIFLYCVAISLLIMVFFSESMQLRELVANCR